MFDVVLDGLIAVGVILIAVVLSLHLTALATAVSMFYAQVLGQVIRRIAGISGTLRGLGKTAEATFKTGSVLVLTSSFFGLILYRMVGSGGVTRTVIGVLIVSLAVVFVSGVAVQVGWGHPLHTRRSLQHWARLTQTQTTTVSHTSPEGHVTTDRWERVAHATPHGGRTMSRRYEKEQSQDDEWARLWSDVAENDSDD